MSQQKKLDVPDRVREYRERTGISQEELGHRLGVSGNYIYLIESGKKQPGDSLLKLFETIEHSEDRFREEAVSAKDPEPNPYSHLEIEILQKSLATLSAKLPALPEQERKYVLGNIRAILDELEAREHVGNIAAQAGAQAVKDVEKREVVFPRKLHRDPEKNR